MYATLKSWERTSGRHFVQLINMDNTLLVAVMWTVVSIVSRETCFCQLCVGVTTTCSSEDYNYVLRSGAILCGL